MSGLQLPRPAKLAEKDSIVDPYVKLRVHGVPNFDQFEDGKSDTSKKIKNYFKTKTIDNNGFNPTWNEYTEMIVHFPELAFLEIRIMLQD